MIPTPGGWTAERLALGVVMYPPTGHKVASNSYRERARPLLRLGLLVRDVLKLTPHWVTTRVGEPERLETQEGEYAALVTVAGTQNGEPAQRDLGFVFGDDFYSSIGGLCRKESLYRTMTETVRELVRQDSHGLGVRRRPLEYAPPAGWQPVPLTGFAVDWLAPGYPLDSTNLTVYAASPHHNTTTISLETLIESWVRMGGTIVSRRNVTEIQADRCKGNLDEVVITGPSGARRTCRVAILRDSLYVYPFEMWSARLTGYHDEILKETLASIRPVPAPSAAAAAQVALDHWLE
jgi:hypothetical protein